jgi:hypothetical protein
MIRVKLQSCSGSYPDMVATYQLVEEVHSERVVARDLTEKDAYVIADLLNVANSKAEQAEINRKLDENSAEDQVRRDAALRIAGFVPPAGGWTSLRINGQPIKPVETPDPGKVEFFPYAATPKENPASDSRIPSTRYPGTFESPAGLPCPCYHCKATREASPQYSIRPMTESNGLWQLLRGDLIIARDMTRQNAEFILSKVRGEQQ